MTLKVEERVSQDDEVNASLWDMEHVIVILDFYDEYERKSRFTPNDVRRFLMDIEHEKKKLSFTLPKLVSKNLEEEYGGKSILIPLYFTLIKNPIIARKDDGSEVTLNRARGTIGVYKAPSTDIVRIVRTTNEVLKDFMRESKYPLQGVTSFKIIIGKEVVEGVKTDD